MKMNSRIYGIVAIAIILLAITSSGVPFVDSFIMKALVIAAGIALLTTVIAGILSPLINTTKSYFTFTNIEEFSKAWNPAITGTNADPAIVAVVNSFLTLLQPFYVIAIVLTGVYLLFIAGTPAGRAKAKSNFWKLVFSMVVVTLSMQLFQIILNLSAALSVGVANIGGIDSQDISNIIMPFTLILTAYSALSATMGLVLISNTLFILAIIYNLLIPFIILLRYVILLILAMLFPFTIFLHFLDFSFTKAFGAKLLRLTFIWVFLPMVMMLAVVGSNIAIGSYAEQCPGLLEYINVIPGIGTLITMIYGVITGNNACWMVAIMSLVGVIIIVATPFMMSGVMTWIGAGLMLVGMANFKAPWGTAMSTFGGVLAGMGPGALMMGGTQAMFAKMAQPPPTTTPTPPPTPPPTP